LADRPPGHPFEGTDPAIIAILKQGEAGLTTAELCRQQGTTEQTYYRWKRNSDKNLLQ
jgi:DNA invertase Pin-like site-specific DNA recombinase